MKLNFDLQRDIERADFLRKNISDLSYTKAELTLMANYLLYGKDENGKNSVQRKEVTIQSRNGTWDKKHPEESLDELMESPTFNEAQFNPYDVALATPIPKPFSRESALRHIPSNFQSDFIELWRKIDTIELTLNYYDINHGKRTTPPREALTSRLSKEDCKNCEIRATQLTTADYMRDRHLLVELRRQQYTMYDAFAPITKTLPPPAGSLKPQLNPVFGSDITILPLGLRSPHQKFWCARKHLYPKNFNESELREISHLIWDKKTLTPYSYIDLRDPEHIQHILRALSELQDEAAISDIYSTTAQLIHTINFYIEWADFNEIYKEILDLKLANRKNQDIAEHINKKYNKSYLPNYISTIFCQKICTKIAEAARTHELIVSNLFFEEEFKRCAKCGEWYLRDPLYFMRRSRAKDGLGARCKRCEKQDRDTKKEKQNNV